MRTHRELGAATEAPARPAARSGWDRRWVRIAALLVVAASLGSGLWLLRWSGGISTATPDTFWYARDAMRYSGHSQASADAAAAKITCDAMDRERPRSRDPRRSFVAECMSYRSGLPRTAAVRFQRIFTSRPGFALLTVPFVRTMGEKGFIVATGVFGVACGVALVVLGMVAGLRPIQALMAEAAFYLLPTGLWASRMLAEPPMMLCLLTALIGTVLLVRRRARIAAAGLLAGSLACLCVIKPANGVALAAVLVAVAVLLPFTRSRRAYLAIAGIAALVLTGNLWISSLLHLPGANETLQDTFTRHFNHPDVSNPWRMLATAARRLWTSGPDGILPRMADDPLIPAAYLCGAVGLFGWLRWEAAWPLFLAGLTGAIVATMHPFTSELSRLSTVTWIPVALGLAALTTPLARPLNRLGSRIMGATSGGPGPRARPAEQSQPETT